MELMILATGDWNVGYVGTWGFSYVLNIRAIVQSAGDFTNVAEVYKATSLIPTHRREMTMVTMMRTMRHSRHRRRRLVWRLR